MILSNILFKTAAAAPKPAAPLYTNADVPGKSPAGTVRGGLSGSQAAANVAKPVGFTPRPTSAGGVPLPSAGAPPKDGVAANTARFNAMQDTQANEAAVNTQAQQQLGSIAGRNWLKTEPNTAASGAPLRQPISPVQAGEVRPASVVPGSTAKTAAMLFKTAAQVKEARFLLSEDAQLTKMCRKIAKKKGIQ